MIDHLSLQGSLRPFDPKSPKKSPKRFSGPLDHAQRVKKESTIGSRYDWKTGVPDGGSEWRKYRVIPREHPLRPCVFTYFNYNIGLEA